MRISDWSSDVCSSDLCCRPARRPQGTPRGGECRRLPERLPCPAPRGDGSRGRGALLRQRRPDWQSPRVDAGGGGGRGRCLRDRLRDMVPAAAERACPDNAAARAGPLAGGGGAARKRIGEGKRVSVCVKLVGSSILNKK